ncbi:MAG TPA: SH3 domain-containing protein [Gemmataceae bacterium]|jgi:hypothetical protein|nr:SH3 domain-containing protein [Gemmataceae bacterium]
MSVAVFIAVAALGAAPATTIADADAEYRAGIAAATDSVQARPHFIRAAETYESDWKVGIRSPATARNMAQCRYLAGDLGGAIRDYRLGLRIFPHDPDLRAGLAFAREQVAYSQVGDVAEAARPRDTHTPLDRLPISFAWLEWAAIALAGCAWIVLARSWIVGRGGLALFGGLLLLTAATAGVLLQWQDRRLRAVWAEPTAVVSASGVELRTGNSDEYPKRLEGRLPAGVEMKVLSERGGWLHVELAGGAVGWVPQGRTTQVQ